MSTVTKTIPVSSEKHGQSEAPNRIRLEYLDGLRGLAALYVMLAHAFTLGTVATGQVRSSFSPLFYFITRGLSYPHYAVAVFIVLSGFCLMLPVARSKDRALSGGFLGFVKRRARRILPPYYVALAFVLCILFVSHHFAKHESAEQADLSVRNIAYHLLLIHNLFSKYNMALDGPMWSAAWEWQIYFLFALILLPIWRRFGILWAVITGYLIGYSPILLLPTAANLSWTAPWYLGLFAMGMAAAVVLSSPIAQYRWIKNPNQQNTVLAVMAIVMLSITFLRPSWLDPDNFSWAVDPIIGAFTALLILACANNPRSSWLHKTVVRGLESRVMMVLGTFSYSLYLVHYPILQKMRNTMVQHHVSDASRLALIYLVGVPVSLGAAYLFHLAFERPYMSKPAPKTERQAEVAAIVNPAP
ncbi:hypothetical protein CCAX7_21370 [Capsulimonas corticalis]|uniref:Uncharacterized protein n=1 Tax=Capsulimonas corticalis TaxID=2219043 RepID=A0A402D1Y6_9BACT|nr:acyltransferase [Capsulimonas corticalis]BDI30086.1 hypothetical protein CCAX7_21370 [Capsulimonas corticalis]